MALESVLDSWRASAYVPCATKHGSMRRFERVIFALHRVKLLDDSFESRGMSQPKKEPRCRGAGNAGALLK
eukprot:scaffold2394_cov276-Pinguiococcus_pyrenoidosus.AAC.6